ncbi:MAG: tRNA (adenosine(37)-N6)-dimethylallyltransferase MiaA [Deltaproteobacteria bacterium HGW-Deltaproteobacteria-6]|jgi:tRNA dimethylallyltransferase|nr:MAG: tRNA (adenosine(37)-N6)-dimethylallyltransferase MiaA [Deltaproteobacteria bacterium HGW-Deltaproteobacteria-6]
MPKIPLVVICSPTATGKTRLAVELAKAHGGEILNADSLQVYRYLDIGTAKPTLAEREGVPHHLIDVVEPDEEFNAAIYVEQARAIIETLAKENKPVFVVGGTGLYIRTLLQGIIETPPVDENIRNYYRQLRDRHGREYLFGLLSLRDPLAAGSINPNDAVRVIRALEVLEQSGQSIIALQQKHAFADCPYDVCKIGLRVERTELKKRIAVRTEMMVETGLVEEVRGLLARGYSEKLKPLQSLGYKQTVEFIRGRSAWDRTLDLINRDTWQYSKRQMTWFSADKAINWFAPDQVDDIRKTIETFRDIKHSF